MISRSFTLGATRSRRSHPHPGLAASVPPPWRLSRSPGADTIVTGFRPSRKGKRAGFPRFRSRRTARPSIRFTTGAFRCEARHAVVPRIGRVKLHEPGTRLADLVAAGTARVLGVSVRFERGRWFAAFTVERGGPHGRDFGAFVSCGAGVRL
jgi:transposase